MQKVSIPRSVTTISPYAFNDSSPVIYGYSGSTAETFATSYGYDFVLLDTYSELSISSLPDQLLLNRTLDASAFIFPASSAPVAWSSSAPDIATIDQNGLITPRAIGQTTITMTYEGGASSALLNVVPNATSLTFDKSDYYIIVREESYIPIVIEPSEAVVNLDYTVDWSIISGGGLSNNGKLSFYTYASLVSTTTLLVRDRNSGLSAECTIHVVPKVSSIELDEQYLTLMKGGTYPLTASVTAGDFSFVNQCVTFSSANPSIATVNSDGVITGVSTGTTTVSVTAGSGMTASCTVVVSDSVSPDHKHNIANDPAVSATCTKSGLTAGTHCSSCGTVFIAQTVIPATGHTAAKPVIQPLTEPTCTEVGAGNQITRCTVCDAVISTTLIDLDPLGHLAVTDPYVAPTYHSYGETEGSHCERCGEVLIAQELIPMLTCGDILRIPEGVTTIEDETYLGCAAKKIILPASCTSIGSRAFAECSDLVWIEISADVTFIAEDAFDGCHNFIIETKGNSFAEEFARSNKYTLLLHFD